jgi:hypothetical protein
LLLASSGLAGIALWLSLRLDRDLTRLSARQRRATIYHTEAAVFIKGREQIAAMQNIAEASVGGGTAAIRTLHKGIASIPFAILESIPVTRDTTRIVRGIHDFTADAVYGTISAINRELHKQARRGLQATGSPALKTAQAPTRAEVIKPALSKKPDPDVS